MLGDTRGAKRTSGFMGARRFSARRGHTRHSARPSTWQAGGLLRRRGLRRAFKRWIVTKRKHDDRSDDGAAREKNEASEIGSRPIAQLSEYFRPEISAEIADRIHRGDACRGSCSA